MGRVGGRKKKGKNDVIYFLKSLESQRNRGSVETHAGVRGCCVYQITIDMQLWLCRSFLIEIKVSSSCILFWSFFKITQFFCSFIFLFLTLLPLGWPRTQTRLPASVLELGLQMCANTPGCLELFKILEITHGLPWPTYPCVLLPFQQVQDWDKSFSCLPHFDFSLLLLLESLWLWTTQWNTSGTSPLSESSESSRTTYSQVLAIWIETFLWGIISPTTR